MVSIHAGMILASLSKATLKVYIKVICEFNEFVLSLHKSLCVFPTSPVHVGLFMSSLYKKGRAVSTIATKLSALAFWHSTYGQPDPTSHFMVRRLTGMKKTKPASSLKPPLTVAD